MRIDERPMVSSPDLCLGTQSHINMYEWNGQALEKKLSWDFLPWDLNAPVIPKPVGEVLMETRLAVHGYAVIDETKMKVWKKSECLDRLYVKWLYILYPNVLLVWTVCLTREPQQRHVFALWTVLLSHANGRLLDFSNPHKFLIWNNTRYLMDKKYYNYNYWDLRI